MLSHTSFGVDGGRHVRVKTRPTKFGIFTLEIAVFSAKKTEFFGRAGHPFLAMNPLKLAWDHILTQMINWSFVLQPQNIFDRPRLRLTITTVGVRMRVLYRILKALADWQIYSFLTRFSLPHFSSTFWTYRGAYRPVFETFWRYFQVFLFGKWCRYTKLSTRQSKNNSTKKLKVSQLFSWIIFRLLSWELVQVNQLVCSHCIVNFDHLALICMSYAILSN